MMRIMGKVGVGTYQKNARLCQHSAKHAEVWNSKKLLQTDWGTSIKSNCKRSVVARIDFTVESILAA
jgi:hypothetical protein